MANIQHQQTSTPTSAVLRRRERSALLATAFFRWESATTLAATIILTVLLPDPFQGLLPIWSRWSWAILGGIAELLILVTTLRDPDAQAQVTLTLIKEEFPLDRLVDIDVRQRLAGALRYREQMEHLLVRIRTKALRDGLRELADQVTDWIATMFQLAARLDALFLATTNTSSTSPVADGKVKDAGAALASSVEAIESVYVQMQLIAARGFESTRLRTLRTHINEQTNTLQKRLQSLDSMLP